MSAIKTKLEKNMAELFDLPEEVPEEKVQETEKKSGPTDVLDDDFESSRKNLETLLSTGQEALQYAMSVAKQSDDPKAYQVVSNMITQLADINEQLLDLHLKKQKHKHADFYKNQSAKNTNTPALPVISDGAQPAQITNNTIFLGSSAELSKLIKQQLGHNEHDVTN